jgi:hypothetical protein
LKILDHIIATLRGLTLQPKLIGFARGTLEAMVFAAISVGYEALASNDLPDEIQPFAFILVIGLRTLEGVSDSIDPAKARRRAELADAAEVADNDPSLTKIDPGDVVVPGGAA